MRVSKLGMISMAAAACVTLVATTALAAAGLIGESSALPKAKRIELAALIDAHRARHPKAFEAVRDVKGHRPEVYRKFRSRKPMVGPELSRLGRPALLPMLEALAFEAPRRRGATGAERRALKVGMLQATGMLRDARSGPVLRLAFEGATDEPVARAAAEAMGRLCDQASFEVLSKAARAAGPKRWAAVRGLGWCRQLGAAELLAGMLDSAPNERLAAVVAEALGINGSSWAWRALGKDRKAEGLAIRELAAGALVPAFIRFGGRARAATRVALTMVEHPQLRALVARHRHRADSATAKQLDRLVARVERRLRRSGQ